jgi:RNA polymerase sigma-70 factor (ECF subfamily)
VAQDDRQLIQATLRGDPAAFGDLVRRYQDRLLTALVHVSGSRDEAEDVAQEAFVQAYVKLATFAGGSSFYTWLYRIAFNAAISRRRKRRGEASIEQTRDLTGSEPADDGEGAQDRLLRHERAGQVQQALAGLAEEFRAVLVLREMEDCDYDTIAQILEVPVGTVRSRLHRARLQMKEQLLTVLAEGDGGQRTGDREH